MLVGPCACGGVHQETDGFVQDLLHYHGATIETINLQVKDGKVYIPRYWLKVTHHENCDVLSGVCKCGETHTANEWWVVELLTAHGATILDCPETELPIIKRPSENDILADSLRCRGRCPQRNEI
jgi:hypothetical protein